MLRGILRPKRDEVTVGGENFIRRSFMICTAHHMSLRHAYLGSFFLESENINNVSLGAIWNFGKATGRP
jgi:hypothetical protein